jgi:uncharacterized membrane protein YjgN (DUF898 family)
MTDFVPTALHVPPDPAAAATELATPPPLSDKHLRMVFTGSGSEYFRIWIVNLLLTLITLTLYLPWARARRLRYFMGNTLVGGQPLGFHGDPRKMFKGYLLVAVFFGLYSVAGKFSATAGFVALLAVVALWPALFKSSLQFRLTNTSWRGLRFGFAGSLGGAYRVMLPAFIPALIMVGAQTQLVDVRHPPQWYMIVIGAAGLCSLAVMPWLLWNLKQYQHNHYTLGSLQTTFIASVGSFYMLSLKVFGLMLLALTVPAAFVFGGMAGWVPGHSMGRAAATIVGILVSLLVFMPALVCVKPFAVSRMQNLVWGATGNTDLRFASALRFRSLLWLSLKNWLLIVLTLGLYWPFALVAMTRLRLEAVSVKTRIDPNLLVADACAASVEAAGDAAGDFFGLDVGL